MVTQQDIQDLWEEEFFNPCDSKSELKAWISTFLKIDLPDQIIDENSTSSPMDFVWEVYDTARLGKNVAHVAASARAAMKCLSSGTLVATPSGPIEIQKLKIGDTVYDENGKPIKVLCVHDQGVQDCVDLINNGKILATCTSIHRWMCFEERRSSIFIVRNTDTLRKGVRIRRTEVRQHLGKVNEPLAYALGAFLGDGCSTECGIRISSVNDLIPNKVARLLNTTALKLRSKNFSYIIKAPQQGVKFVFSNHYENWMRNKHSYEKEVDLEVIKTWNRESLIRFVAGLIDTDGSIWVDKRRKNSLHISFGMQSKSTVEAFQYACNALWQMPLPTIHVREMVDKKGITRLKHGNLYYILVSHNYFCTKALLELDPHLVTPSKKWKPEYEILKPNNFNPDGYGVKIKPSGKHQCYDITVDSPTSLYLLQNGMVTHNTLSVSILEFLLILHFRKTVVHLAAVLDQSIACIDYLNKFLSIPIMEKYIGSNTSRRKVFKHLPPNKYIDKSDAVLKVLVATTEGANSSRGNVLCVSGDTEIVTERRGLTKARELHDNFPSKEMVLTYNEKSCEFEYKPILKVFKREDPLRLIITFIESDITLELTKEHPIAIELTNNEIVYKKAEELAVGDVVLRYTETRYPSRIKSLCKRKITNIEGFINNEEPFVYDFEVQDNHNFIANWVLVHNCYDETDLIERKILSESAMVADPDEKGNPPIFIYISSRKSSVGPIQEKIDLSVNPANKIRLHKWSLVDFLRNCPKEVHKPDKPAVRYIHPDTLEIKDTVDLLKLASGQQETFNPISCWEGCLTCQAFVICQGRAPLQQQNVRVLRDIDYVSSVVRETADSDKIKAQLLNLKPESAGQVFNKFSREAHYRSIEDCYKFAFDVDYDYEEVKLPLNKKNFIGLLKDYGWYVQCGVDFGWQALSVAVLVAHHKGLDKTIILHVDFAQGYANQDWLIFIKEHIYDVYGFDLLCPDCADMSAPKIASKLGMPTRNKKPPKIEKGISWLRSQLWSPSKQKSSLMILAEGSNVAIAKMFEEYQYKKTPTGFLFTQYEDDTVNSDLCFKPGTFIITKVGLKRIEEVQVYDLVLTKEGTWRKVSARLSRQFNGQLWEIQIPGHPTVHCTSNHPFWATTDPKVPCSWMTASRLDLNRRKGKVYTTFQTAPFINQLVVYDLASYVDENYDIADDIIYFKTQRNSINRFLAIDEKTAFVLGSAISMGTSLSDKYLFHPESVNESNFDSFFSVLREYFDNLHIEWTDSVAARNFKFEIKDVMFKNFLNSLCFTNGSVSLPEFYDDLDRKTLLALISGIALNMCQLSKDKCRFCVDATLSYQIYYVLVKLGYTPFWRFNDERFVIVYLPYQQKARFLNEIIGTSWLKECWKGKHIGNEAASDYFENLQTNIDGQLFSSVYLIKSYPYEGEVFNLTVEESHSYTANFNSVSNCDATRYGIDTFIVGNPYTIQAGQSPVPQWYKGVELVTKENPTLPILDKEFIAEEIKVHYSSEYGLDVEDPKIELAKINKIEQMGKNNAYNKGFTFSF